MASKHMKRYSTSLVIWKMKLETVRYHFTSPRLATIKTRDNEWHVLLRAWGNCSLPPLLAGVGNDAPAAENVPWFLWRLINVELLCALATPLPGHLPKRKENLRSHKNSALLTIARK